VEREQEGTAIPEIWEEEEDKRLTIGQLKHRYLQIAKQNFQGKVFTNKDIDKPIRVSAETTRKAIYDMDKFRYFGLRKIEGQ